ncbi:MAG TPA: hypothetical protein VF845_13435, partial [Terriglobales bacterium]
LMARSPRAFPRRGHSEAKAGENIGQGNVTEKVEETNQQDEISEVSPTRSLGRFLGVLSLSDHPKPANEYHLKTGQRE